MRRISLGVLILSLLAANPTLTLAMGAGGGAGAGAGGTGAGGSSGGTGGAGNGAPINVKPHVVKSASNAVKDPSVVQSRDPRSALLERPGRQ